MNRLIPTILSGLLVFFSGIKSATAFENDDIALHGFVSQGYMKSFDNNYFVNTQKGSYEYNEIGINLTVPVSDELLFGIQLFSRDMGQFGNNEFNVDWATLNYYYQSWLGFRAGKINLPFGLYNRKRDADMLRTSVLLPQSVYPEGMRDLTVGIYGGSAYGILNLGPVGYMDYELFAGTFDIPADSEYVKELVSKFLIIAPQVFPPDLTPDDVDLLSVDLDLYHMEGGMLVWNAPLKGFRIAGLLMKGKAVLNMYEKPFVDVNFDSMGTLSAEYDIGSLTFVAEQMMMEISALNVSVKVMGWYAGASWEVTDGVALGVSYGEFYPDEGDRDGSDFVEAGYRDYIAWQKDTTLSTRFNITEFWSFKFETHFINGLGNTSLNVNEMENSEQDWLFFTLKTSLSF